MAKETKVEKVEVESPARLAFKAIIEAYKKSPKYELKKAELEAKLAKIK